MRNARATDNRTSVCARRMFSCLTVIVCTTCLAALSDKEVLAEDLPPGWFAGDVGAVGIAGSATYSNGQFIVSGAGQDIWGHVRRRERQYFVRPARA